MAESQLRELTDSLLSAGFQPYVTSVGGPGLGMSISDIAAINGNAPGANEPSHIPSRKAFKELEVTSLDSWAAKSANWIFT
jgi:hypothetical protein